MIDLFRFQKPPPLFPQNKLLCDDNSYIQAQSSSITRSYDATARYVCNFGLSLFLFQRFAHFTSLSPSHVHTIREETIRDARSRWAHPASPIPYLPLILHPNRHGFSPLNFSNHMTHDQISRKILDDWRIDRITPKVYISLQ